MKPAAPGSAHEGPRDRATANAPLPSGGGAAADGRGHGERSSPPVAPTKPRSQDRPRAIAFIPTLAPASARAEGDPYALDPLPVKTFRPRPSRTATNRRPQDAPASHIVSRAVAGAGGDGAERSQDEPTHAGSDMPDAVAPTRETTVRARRRWLPLLRVLTQCVRSACSAERRPRPSGVTRQPVPSPALPVREAPAAAQPAHLHLQARRRCADIPGCGAAALAPRAGGPHHAAAVGTLTSHASVPAARGRRRRRCRLGRSR